MQRTKSNTGNLANIIAYALIGAIAFVVMKFEFPIMPGVGFLKFDFSDVVITIGTFIFGAGPGIFIAFIRMLISLIFSGFALPSIVGQVAAFVASLSFALPFYYVSRGIDESKRKTLKGHLLPILGLIIGILAMTLVLSVTNAFILTPVYAITSVPNVPSLNGYGAIYNFTVKVYLGQLLHLPSMGAYIFGIIVPFNLLKGAINAVVVYILFEAVLKSIKPFVRRKFNL
ncbi:MULTISPECIES: ECF transporter S component [Lactobacillus]|uniref:Riboflavin transporter n=1 Tax=Lactobacillus xujianguonis TaxID=2495899 RepID=A0A437SY34_9LACO|nr:MULTISPECIES: ECF transporter S component [Lactobacillus]RVU71833.1 ECF transporter S component [Lactobacillus xujianguonis]RVU77609.1 ECF transporter S component [Lactobacillus xujianguonis]